MAGALQDRGTFRGIAATLLSLALIAERAAGRSLPVRFLVLAILHRAEAVARAFIAGATGADGLDEPRAMRGGAVDAEILALRLRMLAAVLGALAGADCDNDDRSHGAASWPPRALAAPDLPATLIFLLPVGRFRRPCRPP